MVLIGSFKQRIVSAIIVTVAKIICDIIALIIIYTTIIYIIIVVDQRGNKIKKMGSRSINYVFFI